MSENNREKEAQIDLILLFNAIWSNRRKVIRWAAWGLVIGVVIAVSIPKQYTSIIKVAPENRANGVGGSAGALASMMGMGGSVSADGLNEKAYPEIIKSTPFMMEFASIEVTCENQAMPLSDYILKQTKKPWWSYVAGFPLQAIGWIKSIGSDKEETSTIEQSTAMQYAFVGLMNAGVDVKIDDKLGLITIVSDFQDPVITKTISDSLIVKLRRYMGNYRTAKTRNSLESSTEQLQDAKIRYYEIDEKYARAVDNNHNLIRKSAQVTLERLGHERSLAFRAYSQLAEHVESLRIKLQEEIPIVTIIEPATTPVAPSAPRTMFIVIIWTFIGAFTAAVNIVIKMLLKKQ